MLIKNGLVFSQGTFSRTDILLEGGSIAAVGEGLAHEESFDASGLIIIPGMVNAHTHLAMTLLRGAGDDMPLQTWLSERIWPLEGNLTRTDCYWGGMLGIVEMIRTGTTCFNDMYFHMDATVQAVKETGMRAALTHAVIDLGDEDKAARELAESDRIEGLCRGEPRLTYLLGPHAPYTCSESFLRNIRARATERGLRIHIHVSETAQEVSDMRRERGMSPVAYLDTIGVLGPDTICAHCVHVNEADRDILLSRGAHVAHCPQSNMKLSSGIAPLPAMDAAGVSLSLGTDGAASNNSLDMGAETKAMALVHKLAGPMNLSAARSFAVATQGGANALGLPVGAIEQGRRADLVFLDARHYSLRPPHDLLSNIVYAMRPDAIRHVMVDGAFLMRDGELTTIDEEFVCEKATEHARALVEKVR